MNTLTTISNSHFIISGKTVKLKIGGFAIVFFKTNQCGPSHEFIPVFKQLSSMRYDSPVTFCIMDLSNARELVLACRNTLTPIMQTPHFIMYYQGNPRASYKGPKNYQSIHGFIKEIIEMTASRHSSTSASSRGGPSNAFVDHPSANQRGYARAASSSQRGPPQRGPPQQQQAPRKYHMPDDMGGRGNLASIDDEDEHLEMPKNITPYNTPWNASNKSDDDEYM